MTTQTALALPDETQFRQDIQAINRFQAIVHQNLVVDQDYGVIPGTTKPTLLKPGAEKIAKLLGLADTYEILDRQEDWNKPFFRYLIKCKLIHVASRSLISEGLGECNSMESKYRWRWLSERDLPQGIDKNKLVTQERTAKTGGHWTVFRFENDDIYSQVNTILKMAKKRALVDAALSAGRLSNVFTQDMEDLPAEEMTESTISSAVKERRTVGKTTHWCQKHNTEYFMRGKMKSYAHPIDGSEDADGKKVWCYESTVNVVQAEKDKEAWPEDPPNAASVAVKNEPEPALVAPESVTVVVEAEEQGITTPTIDMEGLKETMKQVKWTEKTAASWLVWKFKVKGGLFEDVVAQLNREQLDNFIKEINDRQTMS